MPNTKQQMLEARLQRRLRRLGMTGFDTYCDYLFSPEGMRAELTHMIDVVTTNKTEFFRESPHYDYLTQAVLPQLLEGSKIGRHKVLIWSAGCSTGEEPYTLAMVLSEFAKACPGFSFNILATDISTTVLEKAQLGVYDIDKISALPLLLQRRYFIRGNDKNRFCARVIPEIRNNIQFRRLNLLDKEYRIRNQVDIIFCRNVFIYFNRVTQQSVIDKFIERLRPGGYLFLGHTETLAGTKSGLFSVAPAVFRKQL